MINPIKYINTKRYLLVTYFRDRIWFVKSYKELLKQKGNSTLFDIRPNYRIYSDRADSAGIISGDYFHQDLYVASCIFKSNPNRHIDIGSRIDGFVAHVASFREIEILDIRKLESKHKNIKFTQVDLMEMQKELYGSTDSVSSLHTLEHFGLGRYGDSIDYNGYLKGINNIVNILKPNGTFYFSVPIGPQRIEFNAHRVFSLKYLIEILSENFEIKNFSYVNDLGDFFESQILNQSNVEDNFGCWYGCGIFILTKK